MQLVDIILGVPILWAVYKGFRKGLIIEVAGLLALALGVWGAIHFSEVVGTFLEGQFKTDGEFMPVIAWVVTFILIVVLVHLVGKMVEKAVDIASLSFVNKIGGGLLSGFKIALILSLILGSLNSLNSRMGILPEDLMDSSMFYAPLSSLAPTVLPYIKENEWTKKILEEAEALKEEVTS